jgi:glycosyltransferase involved in cell wall biosynthesis
VFNYYDQLRSGVVPKKSESEIGVIIPAYNPDHLQLQELIERLQQVTAVQPLRILVVDDGSQPPLQLPQQATPPGQLLRHNRNRGKGAALKTGFHYFFSDHGFELVITLDADLQHPPEKIPEFIQAYREGKGDIIIGFRRRIPAVMPLARILSNTLTSLIISLLTGQMVRDSQCGFRLIKKSALDHIRLKESGFHMESELLILAGGRGVRFGFVEIPTIYRQEKSSINNAADTLNFVRLILRIFKERISGNV